MNWLEFISEIREAIYLLVGALIGFLSSTAMWRRQLRAERLHRRSELALRAVQLCTSSITYARALFYSKLNGVNGIVSLPDNPVDELMAITGMHFHEACPLTQKLHDTQVRLFSHPIHGEGGTDAMTSIVHEMVPIANELAKKIAKLSDNL